MNEDIKKDDLKSLDDTELEKADGGSSTVKPTWVGFKNPEDYEKYSQWLKATGKKQDDQIAIQPFKKDSYALDVTVLYFYLFKLIKLPDVINLIVNCTV